MRGFTTHGATGFDLSFTPALDWARIARPGVQTKSR